MQNAAKNIVITGASRRLGLFLTEQFLKAGDNVVSITRAPTDALNKLQCEQLSIVKIDEYTAVGAQAVAAKIQTQLSRIDVLIHNASVFQSDSEVVLDLGQNFQALFDIHMAVPAQLNFSFQPLLAAGENANIIHITDIYAENPKNDFAMYCATKAGLENLMKGFAKKFSPQIRVNSIQPGPIQFLPEHSEAHKQQVMGQTLLAKEGGFLPIYVALQGILQNNFMTGASIKVDGGRSLNAW